MPVSSEKREDKLEILVVIQSLKRQLMNHGYLRTRIRSLGKKSWGWFTFLALDNYIDTDLIRKAMFD